MTCMLANGLPACPHCSALRIGAEQRARRSRRREKARKGKRVQQLQQQKAAQSSISSWPGDTVVHCCCCCSFASVNVITRPRRRRRRMRESREEKNRRHRQAEKWCAQQNVCVCVLFSVLSLIAVVVVVDRRSHSSLPDSGHFHYRIE